MNPFKKGFTFANSKTFGLIGNVIYELSHSLVSASLDSLIGLHKQADAARAVL